MRDGGNGRPEGNKIEFNFNKPERVALRRQQSRVILISDLDTKKKKNQKKEIEKKRTKKR